MATVPGAPEDSELSRFGPTPPDPWVLIATYPSAGPWHTAAEALRSRGIAARMPDQPTDTKSIGLLVPSSSAELARQLLVSPPVGISPVDAPHLSDRQRRLYSVAIFLLCGLLILVVLFMVLKLGSGDLGPSHVGRRHFLR